MMGSRPADGNGRMEDPSLQGKMDEASCEEKETYGEETEEKQQQGIREDSFGADSARVVESEGEEVLASRVVDEVSRLEIGSHSSEEQNGSDEEEDGEEDYEDEVWGGPGLRGFLQKPDEPYKISRQYFASKAGGTPAWLDPLNLPKGTHSICGICDKPLQFVLQVYAPAEEEPTAFHRTLFVFACTSLACLQQDEIQQRRKQNRRRSLKVFRSQLPRENSFYSSTAPTSDGKTTPLGDGAPLCTWCGTWKGDKLCGGCKQTRYCSQLHQMDHWRSEHAPYCRRVQELLKATSMEASVAPNLPVRSDLWPEFELVVDEAAMEESDDDSEDNGNSRTGTARLLAEYETRKRQGNDFSSKDVQDVQEASLEEQHWVFFQAKISKFSEQVLWYYRSAEAKPLWPRLSGQPKMSDIPPCPLCGGKRIFEFQILPQLLYFFEIQDDTDSLDWGTIAVYTCARSCVIPAYAEEFAWVQPGFT